MWMVCGFPWVNQAEPGRTPGLSSAMRVEIRQPGAVEAWGSPLSSLHLSFLICLMGAIATPLGGKCSDTQEVWAQWLAPVLAACHVDLGASQT